MYMLSDAGETAVGAASHSTAIGSPTTPSEVAPRRPLPPRQVSLYFVLLVLLGAFFVINLFLAVIFDSFYSAQLAQADGGAEKRKQRAAEAFVEHERTIREQRGDSCLSEASLASDSTLGPHSPARPPARPPACPPARPPARPPRLATTLAGPFALQARSRLRVVVHAASRLTCRTRAERVRGDEGEGGCVGSHVTLCSQCNPGASGNAERRVPQRARQL